MEIKNLYIIWRRAQDDALYAADNLNTKIDELMKSVLSFCQEHELDMKLVIEKFFGSSDYLRCLETDNYEISDNSLSISYANGPYTHIPLDWFTLSKDELYGEFIKYWYGDILENVLVDEDNVHFRRTL